MKKLDPTDKTVRTTICLSKTLLARFDAVAATRRLRRSELLREIIEKEVKRGL